MPCNWKIPVKAVAVGIGAAVVAPILWILGRVALPIATAVLESPNAGAGAIGVAVDSGELLVPAVVGFVLGFGWQLRRTSRRRSG